MGVFYGVEEYGHVIIRGIMDIGGYQKSSDMYLEGVGVKLGRYMYQNVSKNWNTVTVC